MRIRNISVLCVLLLSVLWVCVNSSGALADAKILPSNLLVIETEAFFGDSSIDEIMIPEGAENIGDKAFAYSGLKQIYIPDSITSISANAFLDCKDLIIYCSSDSFVRSFADECKIAWTDISAYKSVIEKYRSYYMNGAKTAGSAIGADVSEACAYSDNAGYFYKDLNNDNIPELIIADDGTGWFTSIVYDLYTLENGIPVRLLVSGPRLRYYLRTDKSILYYGSGGASYGVWMLIKEQNGTLEPTEAIFRRSDSYYYQKDNLSCEPMDTSIQLDKATFDAMRDEYESAVYLPPLMSIA